MTLLFVTCTVLFDCMEFVGREYGVLNSAKKEGLFMRMRDVPNSKELKVFVKGAFVLIGLIYAISCSAITLLVLVLRTNIEYKIFILLLILAILPLIVFLLVFFGFFKLVNKKICASFDNKIEKPFLRKQIIDAMSNTCITVAKIIKPDSEKNVEALISLVKEMPELIYKISSEESGYRSENNESSADCGNDTSNPK